MRKMAVTLASLMLLSGCGTHVARPLPPAPRAAAAKALSADFSPVGHVVEANFGGGHHFNLTFHSATRLTYSLAEGPHQGAGETVKIQLTPVRPGVFMVTWVESDGTSVVHVEDYDKGVVFTNITSGGDFIQWKGTLKVVD